MKLRKFSVFIDEQSIEIVAGARDAGEDLLFFVHGLGCSKDSFHHFWNRSDFNDYSVLAPTLSALATLQSQKDFLTRWKLKLGYVLKSLRSFQTNKKKGVKSAFDPY